jgi:Uma2 family endonuclease
MIAVPSDDLLTVEQFVAGRHELPDGGRWTELIAGRPILLSPPTVEHGNAVLNLGKALAEYSGKEQAGYACFELGFVVARRLGLWWSVAVVVAIELVLLIWIRDNLLLNIVMLTALESA